MLILKLRVTLVFTLKDTMTSLAKIIKVIEVRFKVVSSHQRTSSKSSFRIVEER